MNNEEKIIESISNSERMKKQWTIYSNKYKYAKNIEFSKILNLLKENLKEIELEITAI